MEYWLCKLNFLHISVWLFVWQGEVVLFNYLNGDSVISKVGGMGKVKGRVELSKEKAGRKRWGSHCATAQQDPLLLVPSPFLEAWPSLMPAWPMVPFRHCFIVLLGLLLSLCASQKIPLTSYANVTLSWVYMPLPLLKLHTPNNISLFIVFTLLHFLLPRYHPEAQPYKHPSKTTTLHPTPFVQALLSF